MIDTVKNLYHHYYNVILDWYNGLDQVLQYGFLFFAGAFVFLIVVLCMLAKISK